MKKLQLILFLLITAICCSAQDSVRIAKPGVHHVITRPESNTVNMPVKKIKKKKELNLDSAGVITHSTAVPFLYDSLFAPGKGTSISDIYVRNTTGHEYDSQFALILLAMLIYVTWITYTYKKELRENITVLINANLGQQIYRDREFSANIFKLLTFLNFAVITGILIYLLALHFNIRMLFNNLILDAALGVVFVLAAYFLKSLIYKLLDLIYHFGPAIYFFRFNSLVIYQLLGIGLFPLAVLAVFAKPPVNEWALYASLFITGLALLIRIVKGFSVIGMFRGFHILYFLLYICALEIAPLLILYQLFSMWT